MAPGGPHHWSNLCSQLIAPSLASITVAPFVSCLHRSASLATQPAFRPSAKPPASCNWQRRCLFTQISGNQRPFSTIDRCAGATPKVSSAALPLSPGRACAPACCHHVRAVRCAEPPAAAGTAATARQPSALCPPAAWPAQAAVGRRLERRSFCHSTCVRLLCRLAAVRAFTRHGSGLRPHLSLSAVVAMGRSKSARSAAVAAMAAAQPITPQPAPLPTAAAAVSAEPLAARGRSMRLATAAASPAAAVAEALAHAAPRPAKRRRGSKALTTAAADGPALADPELPDFTATAKAEQDQGQEEDEQEVPVVQKKRGGGRRREPDVPPLTGVLFLLLPFSRYVACVLPCAFVYAKFETFLSIFSLPTCLQTCQLQSTWRGCGQRASFLRLCRCPTLAMPASIRPCGSSSHQSSPAGEQSAGTSLDACPCTLLPLHPPASSACAGPPLIHYMGPQGLHQAHPGSQGATAPGGAGAGQLPRPGAHHSMESRARHSPV